MFFEKRMTKAMMIESASSQKGFFVQRPPENFRKVKLELAPARAIDRLTASQE